MFVLQDHINYIRRSFFQRFILNLLNYFTLIKNSHAFVCIVTSQIMSQRCLNAGYRHILRTYCFNSGQKADCSETSVKTYDVTRRHTPDNGVNYRA